MPDMQELVQCDVENQLDNYCFDSNILGTGAFGAVKRATYIPSGDQVIVKTFNRERMMMSAQNFDDIIEMEIRMLKKCHHPHIIRFYEEIETIDNIYITLEWLANGDMFDYIVSKERLDADEACMFFQQLISGVEHLHFHKIVHRDLKPENFLLDFNNHIKITNFDISNTFEDEVCLKTSCGSPNYAAPELIRGKPYLAPPVDVWSCGVILYAFLCGSLPFDDPSIPLLFKKILFGQYIFLPRLTPLSCDLISKILLVDPIKRMTIPEIKQHPWFHTHKLPQYLQ